MPRPIRATFDLDALRGNLAVARTRAGSARVWTVIKADAYGHGLLRAAQAFAEADTDGYALLDLEDAIRLREAGFRQPILLLEGCFDSADLLVAAAHSLTPVVHCSEQIDMLELSGLPSRLPVYLKLNSGMNRLGFPIEAFQTAYERLARCRSVGSITLMTHFADADGSSGVADAMQAFEAVAGEIDAPRSLANSAALLRFPTTHADWVRPGIMLYGCSPFADQPAESFGLRPVMTLQSELIAIQHLRPGESTGYGRMYTAERPTRVGIVACGYADGYPRHAATGTPVLVQGQRTRIVGRVSMDMLAVDIEDIPTAGIGAPVTLWGEGLPADEVAQAAGTISYELLCALAPRVPRVERQADPS